LSYSYEVSHTGVFEIWTISARAHHASRICCGCLIDSNPEADDSNLAPENLSIDGSFLASSIKSSQGCHTIASGNSRKGHFNGICRDLLHVFRDM